MGILFDSLTLLFLFLVLGVSASFVVNNIKYIGAVLGIRLFVFGILLGLITSLPEFLLGINAVIAGASEISVGNLIGGCMVMLGLILGASLLLGRKITTDGRATSIIPIVLVIFSPAILGIDGRYDVLDGLIMLTLYIILVYYLYRQNHFVNHRHVEVKDSKKVTKSTVYSIIGVAGIILASHWIINITLDLLTYLEISKFVIGLVLLSLGTNLPEISVAITAFFKKTSELSLSYLLSSSFANVFVFGFLAILHPISINTGSAFWLTFVFLALLLSMIVWFYLSGKNISRREGAALLAIYFLFLILNYVI